MFRDTDCVLAPGPVSIPYFIKQTMVKDFPYFASQQFSSILSYVTSELRSVFKSNHRILIGTGSGSLGIESSIYNCFNEGEHVLVLSNGKYGDNLYRMCENRGLNVFLIRNTKEPISLENFDTILSKHKKITGVLVTHVETTTGIKNPIEEYVKIVRDRNPRALMLVDAVSSLVTEQLDSYLYDIVVSASQKGLCCPPGLFLISYSDFVKSKIQHVVKTPMYFDFKNEINRTESHITTYTPAVINIMCLNRMLLYISRIGLNKIRKTIHEHSFQCKRYYEDRGYSIYPSKEKNRANGITALYFKNGGSNLIANDLESLGIYVGRGLREFNDKLLRLGHFSYHHILNDIKTIKQIYETILKIGEKYDLVQTKTN